MQIGAVIGKPWVAKADVLVVPIVGEPEFAGELEELDRLAGGTIRGLRSKLGYLRRLGITALWVSPIFRQVAFEPSYHGYGIQNFLDVDPHFGTREEFRDFVKAAHEQGIYVILDVVAHHTGNVFAYDPDRYATHDPASGRCSGVTPPETRRPSTSW